MQLLKSAISTNPFGCQLTIFVGANMLSTIHFMSNYLALSCFIHFIIHKNNNNYTKNSIQNFKEQKEAQQSNGNPNELIIKIAKMDMIVKLKKQIAEFQTFNSYSDHCF
ncbi:hypothetical protein pb186bvf_018533 [Paramecium bursaria]